MCVILVCVKRKPTEEMLKDAESSNPDGGGIAWINRERNRVEYRKALNAEEVFKYSEQAPFPYIIHFRIATVGGDVSELTHPFPISQSAGTGSEGHAKRVLFHNGHWSDWQEKCLGVLSRRDIKFPEGPWSDSRAMAWISYYYGQSFLELIQAGQRIVVLGRKGAKWYGNGWTEKNGIFLSNENFLRCYSDKRSGPSVTEENWWKKEGSMVIKKGN